jgi:hypothetical protein
MTAGTPKIVVRVNAKVQSLIQSEVDARNYGRKGKPYTMSDFIRGSISEKLKHLARGRKATAKRMATLEEENEVISKEFGL